MQRSRRLTKMSRFAGDLCLKLRRSDIIEAGGIRISRESSRSEPPFWIMVILKITSRGGSQLPSQMKSPITDGEDMADGSLT